MLSMAREYVLAIFVADYELVFVQVCRAVSIAKFSEAEKVVLEVGYDVTGACGSSW